MTALPLPIDLHRLPPGTTGARADQQTRSALLETAGQVFAEKGFDGATGKEICRRAGANVAAINYYFGSMRGLYAATLWEAHSRLVTFDALSSAVAQKADPRAQLRAIISLFIETLTGPVASSWVLRVIAREVTSPSAALDVLRQKELLPKTRVLRQVVGQLMGLPENHPAVARGCLNVMGPCFMLLIGDRQTLARAFPQIGLKPSDAPALVRHMVRFALAGLNAIAAEERAQRRRTRKSAKK
jgi:TetR/AcrR family transcriptional regulator, regulator of cefoperazone and chloramphenicol sensitivity